LKVGYYLPLDTVRPSRRLECFLLYSLSKNVFVYCNFGENQPLITTFSHDNIQGYLCASGAKLVDFIGSRNVPKKKVVKYNRTHLFCPLHFFVILAIFETFKQERANVLKLLRIKDGFPTSLAH